MESAQQKQPITLLILCNNLGKWQKRKNIKQKKDNSIEKGRQRVLLLRMSSCVRQAFEPHAAESLLE